MKKIKNIVLGGIQQKVFNLILIMILLVMAAYSVVILYQMNRLSGLVSGTNDKQKEAIAEISQSTMDAVLSESLTTSAQMQAKIADDLFSGTADTVRTLADYAAGLFEDANRYEAREVKRPDAALDGTASVQLLTEKDTDLEDPAVAGKLGLIGNLSDLMLALYANAGVDSCYIALPEGVMMIVDDHASSKLDGNGAPIPIAIHERAWFTGACETGKLYFTDITSDVFTGQYCVMCSVPVYAGGQLAAVVGADLFLDNMETYVNASSKNGGFVCIVNHQGHVVFSPRTEGLFQVRGSESQDLRAAGNAELAAFIDDALSRDSGVKLINADGNDWYMTGAPIETVGWSVLSLVSKASTDQPTLMMGSKIDTILQGARADFNAAISHARMTMTVLLLVVVVLALAGALTVSTRIVKPLNTITKRISELNEGNLEFKMEDAYRTGDEVEELAQSFADISHKTVEYMDTVRRVTAEKERIGAELSLATDIQTSMLPHIFPAFPDRPEFDIFASMDPAKEVGGDFYDYFLVDDDHLCMVIADVSGKGIPAALFMMASKIILQSYAMLGNSPAAILAEANEAICSNNEAQMFVTVWMGILELSTGNLTCANAGHEFPAIKQPGKPFELYMDKHGFVIGGLEGMAYRQNELHLDPGSKLFVYTDGVAEATNAEEELFGTDRMIQALNAQMDASPSEVLKNVRKAVDEFVQEAEQFDDLTMLCVEYKGCTGKGKKDA